MPLKSILTSAISNRGKRNVHISKSFLQKNIYCPTKNLELTTNPPDPYPTCPYCLTKIELTDTPLKTEEKYKEPFLEVQPKNNKVDLEIKHVKNSEKPAACQYHLGYLNERPSKQQIPDDCLVCKDLVECMLKKMRQ